jgi:hypothetical protein
MIDVMTISNATFFEIIRREFDIYLITIDERDIAFTHMTRDVAKDDHTIIAEFLTRKRSYLNAIAPVGKRLEYSASGKYFLFFSHEF